MFYVIEHRVARQLNMTPVAVMGSRKLPPVVNFDNNNEENDFGNMFKGDFCWFLVSLKYLFL